MKEYNNTSTNKYMFLCDMEKECNKSFSCGLNCHHTADINHAIHKEFDEKSFLKDSNVKDLWWEVEE